MDNGKGTIPSGAVPLLGAKKADGPRLQHYLLDCVDREGHALMLDCLITGYQLDPAGNLHLLMNGGVVASFARDVWKKIRLKSFEPEVVG